jgi:hypothetical protein
VPAGGAVVGEGAVDWVAGAGGSVTRGVTAGGAGTSTVAAGEAGAGPGASVEVWARADTETKAVAPTKAANRPCRMSDLLEWHGL